jgi:hypothetical protein
MSNKLIFCSIFKKTEKYDIIEPIYKGGYFMDQIKIVIYVVLAIIALYIFIAKILGLRIVKSDEVGVIEKWWSFRGSLKNSIIALNGEAG